MPEVDPEDDTLTRFVVWHFRYDPDRHERRNVLVTAYDNSGELEQAIERLRRDVELLKASGEAERCEHITGVVYRPGDRERARRRRIASRARLTGSPPPGNVEGRPSAQLVVIEDDAKD
jgi:hypothetical protein